MNLPLYLIFEYGSLLVALVCYKGLLRYRLTAFVPVLAAVCVTETLGADYTAFGWKDTYIVYNIYHLVTTPLFFGLYSSMLHLTRLEKKIFLTVCGLAIFFILFNFFFYQGPWVFNTYSALLIYFLHIAFSSLVLLGLTIRDDTPTGLIQKPYFWISSAQLLFSLVTLVLVGLQQYILRHKIQLQHQSFYHALFPTVGTILYSGYSFAFILCRILVSRSFSPS